MTMGAEQDPTHPTGVIATNGKESDADRPRERKANDVIAMRLAGYSWEEIATVLGYPSPKAALVAFETGLERDLKNDPQQQAKMRDLAGRRLERLLRAVYSKAIDPEHPEQMVAHQRALAVIDRHAKLYGLDAPTQYVVHNPTQEEIHQWVGKVLRTSGGVEQNADIFDLDPEDVEEVEQDALPVGS